MNRQTSSDQSQPTGSATPASPISAPQAKPGKYLTFRLAEGDFGIELLKVSEIIRVMPITPIPHLPPAIKGVINLRGKVIPVLDLRTQFSLPVNTDQSLSCIIVVQLRHENRTTQMGILVDSVSEVLDIREGEIDPPPPFGSRLINTSFLLGIGKVRNVVKVLLNIDRVVSPDEFEQIARAA